MSEIEVIRAYYERIVSADFPHAGELDDPESKLKAVTVRGCHGNTKNLLFFSTVVTDGRLQGIRYECQYCDVTMYITAELICELVDQQPIERLGQLGKPDFARALGGESKKVFRQIRTSLDLLREGLEQKLAEGSAPDHAP